MTHFNKRLFVLALLAGTATTVPLAHAEPCEGDLLESQQVSVGNVAIGQLELRYDRVNAQHCASMKHLGPTLGLPSYTHVAVFACKDRQCTQPVAPTRIDSDLDYVEEAGPVRINAAGQCVAANGALSYLGQTLTARGKPHCN